jgi:hypothetical protein
MGALTVKLAAERLGVNPDKIRLWIRRGDLSALNVAAAAGGQRPRWRIPVLELELFEGRRRSTPLPRATPRRRRRHEQVTQYF